MAPRYAGSHIGYSSWLGLAYQDVKRRAYHPVLDLHSSEELAIQTPLGDHEVQMHV